MVNHSSTRLVELALLFLKLGTTSFGGPAVHIAMLEDEVVGRDWITRSHFLDLLGATNLIPGPSSTQMAIHMGYVRAGGAGLVIAGVCFILPASLIVLGIAWAYVTWGTLPLFTGFLIAVKPAVLGIIFSAVWKLGKTALKSWKLWLIGLAVVAGLNLGLNQLAALLLGGVLGMFWLHKPDHPNHTLVITAGLLGTTTKSLSVLATIPLWQLGLFFLKVGSLLFGGGYLLVAFLQDGLVQPGWLTQQQLLDAIAIGQFTPGPILTTATFVGYVLAGAPGAVVATVAIFFPSFILVAILNPLVGRLRSSKWTGAFLDAVNISAVALMAVVTANLAQEILTVPAIAVAIITAVLAICYRVNAAVLILGGALVSTVFH